MAKTKLISKQNHAELQKTKKKLLTLLEDIRELEIQKDEEIFNKIKNNVEIKELQKKYFQFLDKIEKSHKMNVLVHVQCSFEVYGNEVELGDVEYYDNEAEFGINKKVEFGINKSKDIQNLKSKYTKEYKDFIKKFNSLIKKYKLPSDLAWEFIEDGE